MLADKKLNFGTEIIEQCFDDGVFYNGHFNNSSVYITENL